MTTQQKDKTVVRLRAAFPQSIAHQVDNALLHIPLSNLIIMDETSDIGPVNFRGENLEIPYRIYWDNPPDPESLIMGELEQLIYSCLCTRNNNGRVRELHLRRILRSREEWVPAFILQPLGEYVLELTQIIADSVDLLYRPAFARFLEDNPQFLKLTQARIISYWDCYYRHRFPHFRDYPGYQIMNSLEMWNNRETRRLLRK